MFRGKRIFHLPYSGLEREGEVLLDKFSFRTRVIDAVSWKKFEKWLEKQRSFDQRNTHRFSIMFAPFTGNTFSDGGKLRAIFSIVWPGDPAVSYITEEPM